MRVMTSLGISLAVTAIAGGMVGWSIGVIQDELAERPPIAILDYAPLVNGMSAGEKPAVIETYLAEFKRRASAYENAGFVVINAASVVAAPDYIYVPLPEDLPKTWHHEKASDSSGGMETVPDTAGALK